MKNNLSPICLFVYNRLHEIQQTIIALQDNFLAKESDLIIFSDGYKNDTSKIEVKKVRSFVREIKGFKTFNPIYFSIHYGGFYKTSLILFNKLKKKWIK